MAQGQAFLLMGGVGRPCQACGRAARWRPPHSLVEHRMGLGCGQGREEEGSWLWIWNLVRRQGQGWRMTDPLSATLWSLRCNWIYGAEAQGRSGLDTFISI